MKRGLVFVLLFCIVFSSFSIAKDISIEEVDVEDILTSEVSEGLTRYVYGSGLVASVKDFEVNYYHSDRMQSNRLITDSDGAVEKEFKSLPFGQEISNSGVRYAFATGKELDSSDLYYFGARYYDSDLGRFTSVDPIKENEPYSYVRNNPLTFVDPSGMEEEIQQDMNWFEKTIDFFLGLIWMDKESRVARHNTKIEKHEEYLMSHVFVNPTAESSGRRTFDSILKQIDKEDWEIMPHFGDEEDLNEALTNLIQKGLIEHGWSKIGVRKSKVNDWLDGEISDEELYYGGNEYYIVVQYSETPAHTKEIIHYSEPSNWLGKFLERIGLNEPNTFTEIRSVPARTRRIPSGLSSEPPTESDYHYARVNTIRSMAREGVIDYDYTAD